MNKWIGRALALTTSVAVAGGFLSVSAEPAGPSVTLNLVAINDFHGHVDENTVQWAGTVEQLAAEAPADNTLLISAGDNIGTSTLASALQKDEPAIDVLNAVGLDVSAVGNHEFDRGYDDLVGRVLERADFPVLGANVRKSDGSAALEASAVFTVGGQRVAVVGAVTDTTPSLVPQEAVAGLSFQEPVAAINAEVERLEALPQGQRPDVIVAAIHEGAPWGTWRLDQAMQASSAFRSIIEDTSPAVDAIITGHTHNTYVFDAPVPGSPNRTRPVIQTGQFGTNVGQVKLTVDVETGDVRAHTARNVARVTTSDEDLIAQYPSLAQVAQIRDDAVTFAHDHQAATEAEAAAAEAAMAEADAQYSSALEASEAAQTEFTAAMEASKTAQADYEAALQELEAARAVLTEATETANAAKADYQAAIAVAQSAVNDRGAALARAEEAKQEYLVAADAANAAKADYAAASATANEARAEYLVAMEAVEKAKSDYAAAVAAAMADAAATAFADYTAAMEAAQAAVTKYSGAVASGQVAVDAYTAAVGDAQVALGKYQTAIADGEAAKAVYDEAMADAQEAAQAYADAVATGQTAMADMSLAVAAGELAKAAYETALGAAQDALDLIDAAREAAENALASYLAALSILKKG